MPRTGFADLPLHGGRCPPWLFQRMKDLAAAVAEAIVLEYGAAELLRRLADPFWFQALGCLLGFDWHSSGLTTTVTGALKAGLSERGPELGVFIAGGKGGTSRKTPQEIEPAVERHARGVPADSLVYASKMPAKVDSAALQDGFTLYHHTFVFTADGRWVVVQQGMQEQGRWARRYHWHSDALRDFVEEPHAAVCSDRAGKVLNLTDRLSAEARAAVAALAREQPERVARDYRRILERYDRLGRYLTLPAAHAVPDASRLEQNLRRLYERAVPHFEALLGMPGVGAQTVRALTMVAEIVHGVPVSFRDPVRYSFAHGGKDGHPYPVNRAVYERSIETLRAAVDRARLGQREKLAALRRLAAFAGQA